MLSILEEESHLLYHVPTDHPLGGTSRAIVVEAVVRYLSICIELLMLIYLRRNCSRFPERSGGTKWATTSKCQQNTARFKWGKPLSAFGLQVEH
jgi:hypothetical protein